MRTEGLIFVSVAAFTAVIGLVYWFTSYEPTGTTLLGLAVGFGIIPGAFLLWRARRMAPRPEDRTDALPGDAPGPVGAFPESSVWPLVLAAGAALTGIGLVFGLWAALPGVVLLGVTFVAATLESRGTQ